MDDTVTDRQRQAEALANSQIPGLTPENEEGESKTVSASERDLIDVSGAPVEPPTPEEIERITVDVIGQLKSVYDPEIPTDIYELGLIYKVELEDDRLAESVDDTHRAGLSRSGRDARMGARGLRSRRRRPPR